MLDMVAEQKCYVGISHAYDFDWMSFLLYRLRFGLWVWRRLRLDV